MKKIFSSKFNGSYSKHPGLVEGTTFLNSVLFSMPLPLCLISYELVMVMVILYAIHLWAKTELGFSSLSIVVRYFPSIAEFSLQ